MSVTVNTGNGGQATENGARGQIAASGEPTPEQQEAAYQAYTAALHSNHCGCVERLAAALARQTAALEELLAAAGPMVKWVRYCEQVEYDHDGSNAASQRFLAALDAAAAALRGEDAG